MALDNENLNLDDTSSNADVRFDESQYSNSSYGNNTSKLIQAVIKYSGGLVKNEKQATYVLIVLIIVFLLISLSMFKSAFSGPSVAPEGFRGDAYDLLDDPTSL